MSDTEVPKKKITKKEYLKGWIPYRIKRYWVYAIISLAALIMPWITIGGNHLILISFVHTKLHLMGTVFDVQDLLPLVFLLILLFVGIFSMTAIGGRVWCGWGCPQTIFRVIFRDLIETKILGMRKRIKNKQLDPDMSLTKNKIKKVIAILIWTVLAFVAASDFIWYFVPPEDFFSYLQNPSDHMVMIGFVTGVALFIVADVVFIKENFCVYICPYSRVQSVLYDDDTIMAIYNPGRGGDIYSGEGDDRHKVYNKKKELVAAEPKAECTTCESCVTVCPTHIDIRKGLQLECINCLECVDACTTVMGALGKPSLIEWDSENEVLHDKKTSLKRPKAIAYLVVLGIIISGLFMAAGSQENMLLNIDKSTRLYKIVDGNKVQNIYMFLFENIDSKNHEYFFKVEGLKGIKIIRPKGPVAVAAGFKEKTPVILETDKILVRNTKKNVPLPITIKAYAVDDPKKIVVFRKSVFVYPAIGKIKAK